MKNVCSVIQPTLYSQFLPPSDSPCLVCTLATWPCSTWPLLASLHVAMTPWCHVFWDYQIHDVISSKIIKFMMFLNCPMTDWQTWGQGLVLRRNWAQNIQGMHSPLPFPCRIFDVLVICACICFNSQQMWERSFIVHCSFRAFRSQILYLRVPTGSSVCAISVIFTPWCLQMSQMSHRPIGGQYWGHVTSIDQSQTTLRGQHVMATGPGGGWSNSLYGYFKKKLCRFHETKHPSCFSRALIFFGGREGF